MSPDRLRRWSLRLGLLLVFLLLGLGIATWAWLRGGVAQRDGHRPLEGLQATVVVSRDAQGTVTFDAATRQDLDLALGFVHGQERFFAMDLMRRVAAGELAELIGPAALDADLNHRRHRLRAVAQAAYAALPIEQQQRLQRYARGVNQGLDALHARPWEYLMLRSRPEPWRPEDSLLVIAAMYLDLNDDGQNQRELGMAQMRDALPDALVDFLIAPDPTWEAPLDGTLSPHPAIPDATVFDLHEHMPTASSEDAGALAKAIAPALDDVRPGSNSFAVAGSLSTNGSALLANDRHLGLRVPNIWFRARLRYRDAHLAGGWRDLNGVTLPGTPAMVVGSNGQIAWGFTNSYGDWQDWVRVERDPADRSRYKVPEGWASFATHREIIRIRGAASQTLLVEETRWGPLMAKDGDGTDLALAWTGGQPRSYNFDLIALETASDTHSALDLAPRFGIPPQNLLVADRAGHIGWTIAGNSLPLRGGRDGQRVAAGADAASAWQGWLKASDYPRIEDPAEGRLWTANNRLVGEATLELLGNGGHDLGARAQQIRDDLRARNRFTPHDLLAVQLDDRAAFLGRWQRLLQDTLAGERDPALVALRQATADWRQRAAADSVDYRLVRAFHDEASHAVLAPFVERVVSHHPQFTWPVHVNAEGAVWALLSDQPKHLLDPAYADWHALLVDAARRVALRLGHAPGGLAAQSWGQANRAAIDQPLARALPSFLARWLDMPHIPQDGDTNMPRVAAPAFGASERLDVAPGHEAEAILHMPGGQSDNPLSPFYGAGHDDWAQGRASPLLPGPTRYRLDLTPSR